jgi:hypothetical protein
MCALPCKSLHCSPRGTAPSHALTTTITVIDPRLLRNSLIAYNVEQDTIAISHQQSPLIGPRGIQCNLNTSSVNGQVVTGLFPRSGNEVAWVSLWMCGLHRGNCGIKLERGACGEGN